MNRRDFYRAALALVLPGRAFAQGPAGPVRADLMDQAKAAWRHWPQTRRDRLAIVDFRLLSIAARLFLVDIPKNEVRAFRTAHGRGSDRDHDALAESFSNAAGSLASSLGAYATGMRYYGGHGLSLRLTGLEPSNDAALARAIVLHSADYMTPEYIRRFGRPGRSFGCFVVDPAQVEAVIDFLEGGVLLFAGA
jgi:hypothetical protein